MFKNKKAATLAVNTVVMLIIGLTIFGLGMGLFGKLSSSAEDEIDSLNNQIKTDIANLECDGDDWVCVPSYKIKNGAEDSFQIFIANHGDLAEKFKVELNLVDIGSGAMGIDKSSTCGAIAVSYLRDTYVNVRAGYSASMPFIVKATRVSDTPCSFVTTATLTSETNPSFEEKSSVIIRVE